MVIRKKYVDPKGRRECRIKIEKTKIKGVWEVLGFC